MSPVASVLKPGAREPGSALISLGNQFSEPIHDVKVVRELMRHAGSRFTLEVYSQARKAVKRQAQQRVVQMILPESFDDVAPAISLGGARPNAK